MIKVITFDLDDTLWDANPVLERAERAVYQWLARTCPTATETHSLPALRTLRRELAIARPDLTHQITKSRHLVLQTVLRQAGFEQREAADKADEGIAVFLGARHEVQFYPVVEPMLAKLAEEFTLAALTNGNADIFRTPMGRHFTFAYSAEALNSSKPQAAHFERTEQRTGAAPNEILHVGDHIEHDIEPASARGWHTIWVSHARGPKQSRELNPIPCHNPLRPTPTGPKQDRAGHLRSVKIPAPKAAHISPTATVDDINELPKVLQQLLRAQVEQR